MGWRWEGGSGGRCGSVQFSLSVVSDSLRPHEPQHLFLLSSVSVRSIPFLSFIAGGDGGQEEKGTTEDEMAGWHHGLDGRESE